MSSVPGHSHCDSRARRACPDENLGSKPRDDRERLEPWEPSVHAMPRQIHNRGELHYRAGILISGVQTHTFVILAQSRRRFSVTMAPTLTSATQTETPKTAGPSLTFPAALRLRGCQGRYAPLARWLLRRHPGHPLRFGPVSHKPERGKPPCSGLRATTRPKPDKIAEPP